MKKAIAMFLTLAMGVTMLAGCGNSSSTTAGGGETPAAGIHLFSDRKLQA